MRSGAAVGHELPADDRDGRGAGAPASVPPTTGSRMWNTMKSWPLGLGLAILVAVPLGILVGTSNFLLPLRTPRGRLPAADPVDRAAAAADPAVRNHRFDLKVFMAALGAVLPALLPDDVRRPGRGPRRPRHRQRLPAQPLLPLRSSSTCRVPTPYIATGLRISASVSLVVCVATELIVGVPRARPPGIFKAQYAGQLSFSDVRPHRVHRADRVSAESRDRLQQAGAHHVLRWHPSQRIERPT